MHNFGFACSLNGRLDGGAFYRMEEAEQDQGQSISAEETLNQLHKSAYRCRDIIRAGVCVYIRAEKWND